MAEEKNLYRISEFNSRNGTSRNMLERMWALDIGPRKTYIGTRVMIAAEDEKAWLELMRNPTGKAKKFVEANVKMLHEKAQRAGAAFHTKRGRQA